MPISTPFGPAISNRLPRWLSPCASVSGPRYHAAASASQREIARRHSAARLSGKTSGARERVGPIAAAFSARAIARRRGDRNGCSAIGSSTSRCAALIPQKPACSSASVERARAARSGVVPAAMSRLMNSCTPGTARMSSSTSANRDPRCATAYTRGTRIGTRCASVRQNRHSSAQKPSAFANTRVASDRHGSFTYAVAGRSDRAPPANSSSTRKFWQLLLSNTTPGRRTRVTGGSTAAPSGAPERSSALITSSRANSSGVAGSARPSDAPTRSDAIRPAAVATCQPSASVPSESVSVIGAH